MRGLTRRAYALANVAVAAFGRASPSAEIGASVLTNAPVARNACSPFSIVSLVSFSSDSRRKRKAIEINKSVTASTGVQELLKVVTESHREFNYVNVATSWSKLAKLVHGTKARDGGRRRHEGNKDVFELLSTKTAHKANEMHGQEVANTMWAVSYTHLTLPTIRLV